MRVRRAPSTLVLAVIAGCSTPVVKPLALDATVLELRPLPTSMIEPERDGERRVHGGGGWLADVDPRAALTFAAYRPDAGERRFCVVLACDPASDRLVLLFLGSAETPLSVLADDARRAELERAVRGYPDSEPAGDAPLVLSLRQVVAARRLDAPLPRPAHVYAVAANFRSHLEHDLALDVAKRGEVIATARPRVFLKYPPVPPPQGTLPATETLPHVLGPYDEIRFPSEIALPPRTDGTPQTTPAHVDYEAEVAVVIGRRLTWNDVRDATDDDLRRAVAGWVLVGDAKARNPQVITKIIDDDLEPRPDDPYRFDDAYLDGALGVWNERTCQWWSHAASWGSYTSAGPFFVAARPGPGNAAPAPRALIAARSYAPPPARTRVPGGRSTDVLYLRQASTVTEGKDHADAMYWTVPQILRSIVAPDSALGFLDGPVALEPGDVVCLGTPGGTVITAKSPGVVNLLTNALFFWRPRTWHDKFFEPDADLYLRPGDEVLMWASGLGYQHLRIGDSP